jgi:hypothetical protein
MSETANNWRESGTLAPVAFLVIGNGDEEGCRAVGTCRNDSF